MSMSSKGTPTDSDSALNVPVRYQLAVQETQANNIKCTQEDKVTPHEYAMILAVDIENPSDVMATREMARRLLCCQSCGNIRLIK